MEKNSTSDPFLSLLQERILQKKIPPHSGGVLKHFYLSYMRALQAAGMPAENYLPLFVTYLNEACHQIAHPYLFSPYHIHIRAPFDYHAFGLDFVRPLVDKTTSSLVGMPHIDEIYSLIKKGDNVIFLANHQTEADPQFIALLLEDAYPELGSEMIFVAGERVITDPLAVPLSLGCNLLCIFSKRYIDYPPEEKARKQLHNKKTMKLMSELLSEGGKIIYVAPSGGRDRMNTSGIVEIAPFDPQSIEMFYLMAQKAKRPTHFYPMALNTYTLLPPPETIQRELGEMRLVSRGGAHLAIGAEIDMEHPRGDLDKHTLRKARAEYIWKLVYEDYLKLQE